MKKQNNYFVQQDLLDHAKNPSHYGVLENADFASEQYNPSCGDSVQIFGNIKTGMITKLSFVGNGCVLSLAMASKLTEHAKDLSISEALSFQEELVEEVLGISLGPNRMQCGMLAIMALQSGLREFLKSQNA